MKKFLIVFFALFFTLVGLSACKLWPEKSSDNGNQIPDLPSEFEDINLKVYSDEKGVITWSYSGELHCEVLMEIFYGGELGVDPNTPVNKIRESLENIQAISFSVEEKRFNPAEQEFWSDLSSGIYTVALEFFLEKHLTYVFAFEKEEITDFLIEFIDGRSEKVIYSFELPIGKELTLDSYPDLPSDGPGYTVSWSNTDSFIPDRNVKIYAVYNYTQYAINYVYDDELFEEAYGGHDYYTVATDSSGEIMPVSLKTMYSAKKKFLGWSTQLNGQPIREFKADLSNLNGVTLYLIAEDYTSEELSFYQQFENTLNLSQYTLTNVEEDRIIVVDKASKYAHTISQFSNNEKKSTVIWYGDYYYNLSGGWYCEKPFEEEISHITDIGLAHCFPKNKCATNIVKTADGYQYDLVFADESYAFTVKSNGNYFTAIESEYAKTYIKATLSNKAEKLKIPTNLEFKVFPRTTVTDVDLGEFVFDLDTSHLNYADFVEYFEKSTFNYESKHIYLGFYTDKELTTPLTESYYNSNKNNRLSIYTKFIDKKEYIDRILIGVDVYVEYDHSQTGQRNKVLLESLSLSVSDLVLLPALCEKYDGWGQYGYILSNDMATVYDPASLILKEGKGRVGIFNEIDVYQWISTNLNKLISGDYSIEVCIFTDVQSCHITIEGYGSFYHDPYFSPTEWLIEKDGMVPSGYYKDAECTNSIREREYLGSEVTIYCTWEKGEIVTITVYEDENRNKQIKTSTAVSIYDLSGYWWVDQPFFYDKQLTLAVPYGTRPEDGKTYYINSSIKEVEFTIICNQVAYKTKGYKNTSLQFNMLSRNGIFSKIESDLRKLDLLPDYSESFLNSLIKEGGTYELSTKEKAKYYIYFGDKLKKSGYINANDVDDFARNIQTAKEQYGTVMAYAKDTSGRLTLTTVETYLTANLTTKEPYEVTQTPTESINLYIVGDFIITNFTLVTSSGTQSKEYVLSGELTVAEFIRSVLMIENWWNYKVEKDGKEITTNELFAEKVCEGNYTVTQINK